MLERFEHANDGCLVEAGRLVHGADRRLAFGIDDAQDFQPASQRYDGSE